MTARDHAHRLGWLGTGRMGVEMGRFDLAEPCLTMLGRGVTYVGDGEEART